MPTAKSLATSFNALGQVFNPEATQSTWKSIWKRIWRTSHEKKIQILIKVRFAKHRQADESWIESWKITHATKCSLFQGKSSCEIMEHDTAKMIHTFNVFNDSVTPQYSQETGRNSQANRWSFNDILRMRSLQSLNWHGTIVYAHFFFKCSWKKSKKIERQHIIRVVSYILNSAKGKN